MLGNTRVKPGLTQKPTKIDGNLCRLPSWVLPECWELPTIWSSFFHFLWGKSDNKKWKRDDQRLGDTEKWIGAASLLHSRTICFSSSLQETSVNCPIIPASHHCMDPERLCKQGMLLLCSSAPACLRILSSVAGLLMPLMLMQDAEHMVETGSPWTTHNTSKLWGGVRWLQHQTKAHKSFSFRSSPAEYTWK